MEGSKNLKGVKIRELLVLADARERIEISIFVQKSKRMVDTCGAKCNNCNFDRVLTITIRPFHSCISHFRSVSLASRRGLFFARNLTGMIRIYTVLPLSKFLCFQETLISHHQLE